MRIRLSKSVINLSIAHMVPLPFWPYPLCVVGGGAYLHCFVSDATYLAIMHQSCDSF